MNKNLKLFLGLSLMSVLSVALFAVKNNANAADAFGYGYSCTNSFGYGYSCTVSTPAGGTYGSNPVNTVFSGGQVVSVIDLLNNNPTPTTTTNTNTPMIINLSNGGTASNGSTSTSNLDNGDVKFVLPNTGVTN